MKVFDEGEVRTWTLFACKDGVAANMCDMADEVDVRVVASVVVEEGEHGDPDTLRTFDYSTALIHVQDEPARVFDAHTGSITNASTVSWQTATDAHMDYTGTRTGVKTGLYTAPVNDYIDNWTNHHPTFRSSGLDGGDPPGNIHVRSSPNGNAFWLLTSTTSYTAKLASAFPLTSTSNVVTQLFLDFDQIGTYVVDYDVDMLHASIDVDGETGPDTFSGTGRTIFHVGPIAELGVGDGGVSPDATADQVAFTVEGINNRDEDAESGKIVVELPAGTTGLTTVPASTGVFDSNASPPTWTWDIHDLDQTGDIRASKGLPPGIIVTLIAEGVTAGQEATANIVYDLYEVCIDGSGADVEADNQADCKTDSGNTNVWHAAVCVNTASNEIDSTITVEATCDSTTDREWTEDVCASSGGDVLSPSTEGTCYGWYTGTVLDYNDDNDTATLTARAGDNHPAVPTLQNTEDSSGPSITVTWDAVDYVNGVPVTHYEVQRQTNPWMTLANDVEGTEYMDTGVSPGDTFEYRVRAVNGAEVAGPWSAPMSGTAPAPETPDPEIRTVVQERVVTEYVTVTVKVPDDPFAYFSPIEVARSVLENSAAGSPVGAPVAVIRNSGNRVTYSLEGADAALFTIEADTGQILVGQDTALDYESGATSYAVEVVANPSSGNDVRATVTINVIDVVENATVAITPAGQPEVGTELTATLTHEGGDPTGPAWQWQRSVTGRLWQNIAGATSATYTPTEQDAGHMLRVIVLYGEPSGDGHGVAATVTEALAGEAPAPALYDTDGDGSIDLDETMAAIADHFSENLDLEGVLEVIGAYFAG